MKLELGDVVRTKSLAALYSLKHGHITMTYKASSDRKTKRNMVLLFLGIEEQNEPLSQEELEVRMGDLGWKRMTDKECLKHAKKRANL